jgi:hypothetical protein
MGLTTIPLMKPIQIFLADAEASWHGLVTHKTIPVQLYVGNHIETIKFLVTKISSSLGFGLASIA